MVLGRTLKALRVLALGLIGGGILWSVGFFLIGLILTCAAIPAALTVWILDDD